MEKKRILFAIIGLFSLTFQLYPSSTKIEYKPNWRGVVRQNDSYSCGYCCLKMVFRHYKVKANDDEMRKDLLDEKDGTNMLFMKKYADKYDITSEGLELTYDGLINVSKPIIVRIKKSHFVVLDSTKNDSVYVRNPNKGRQTLFKDDFIDTWDGNCLIFNKNLP